MTTEVIQNADAEGQRLDVVLRGYVVPLSALKDDLRQRKIRQRDLEDETGLSQTTVSKHLLGKNAMAPELYEAIAEVYFDADIVAEIPGAYLVGTEPPASSEEEDSPSQAHLIEEDLVFLEDKEAVAPAEVAPEPALTKAMDHLLNRPADIEPSRVLTPFPLEEAHKLVLMVRKEYRNGKSGASQNFSMRKLKLWGEVFYLLQAAGFSVDDALMGGYHVTTLAKTLPKTEERTFVTRAFDTLFAMEPKLPVMHANTARAEGNRHPCDFIVEPLVRAGLPVWMVGDSATGKSWSAKDLARRVAGGFLRIQGTDDTREEDFVGSTAASHGSTYHQPGPLPVCMDARLSGDAEARGCPLIIDEMSFIPSGSLASLQAVLEGDPLVVKAAGGIVVEAQPGFSILVTDNTRGLGEGLSFVGTEVVNESIRDRFVMVEYDYMPPSQEKLAVSGHLDALLGRNNWRTG